MNVAWLLVPDSALCISQTSDLLGTICGVYRGRSRAVLSQLNQIQVQNSSVKSELLLDIRHIYLFIHFICRKQCIPSDTTEYNTTMISEEQTLCGLLMLTCEIKGLWNKLLLCKTEISAENTQHKVILLFSIFKLHAGE